MLAVVLFYLILLCIVVYVLLFWRTKTTIHLAQRHDGVATDFITQNNGFVLYERPFDNPENDLVLTMDIKAKNVHDDLHVILNIRDTTNPHRNPLKDNQYFGTLHTQKQGQIVKHSFTARLTADELKHKTVAVYLRNESAITDRDRERYMSDEHERERCISDKHERKRSNVRMFEDLKWVTTEQGISKNLVDSIVSLYTNVLMRMFPETNGTMNVSARQ